MSDRSQSNVFATSTRTESDNKTMEIEAVVITRKQLRMMTSVSRASRDQVSYYSVLGFKLFPSFHFLTSSPKDKPFAKSSRWYHPSVEENDSMYYNLFFLVITTSLSLASTNKHPYDTSGRYRHSSDGDRSDRSLDPWLIPPSIKL